VLSGIGICVRKLIKKAADIILNSELTIALTGAGISVESGIPDFRSADGFWSKYDPSEYANINTFRKNPDKVWVMIRELDEMLEHAKPNRAHKGLGELERMGLLHYIITQNIDNLHQEGGAKNVIEYHGTGKTLTCLGCGKKYTSEEKRGQYPPKCECQQVLKPDIVFFGEAIPPEAMNLSFQLTLKVQTLMIVGTSAVVSPANIIPMTAKQNGAKLIEINKERTRLTDSITDVFLQGGAGEIVSSLLSVVKNRINQ
jgi:NAD-dependent deacetylase